VNKVPRGANGVRKGGEPRSDDLPLTNPKTNTPQSKAPEKPRQRLTALCVQVRDTTQLAGSALREEVRRQALLSNGAIPHHQALVDRVLDEIEQERRDQAEAS